MNQSDAYNTPIVDVSPLSIKTRLNFRVEIGVHTMLWWGSGSHPNVGYRSDDPAVIASQLATMKQRGADFVFLNWYGTLSAPAHAATMAWIKICEAAGFPFAVCMARGMFETYNMPKGQDVTAWGVQMMQFARDNFLSSPMYKKTADGRFLMVNFDWTGVDGLDEATILAPYADVAMVYEHSTGVSKPHSAGGFAWIGVNNANKQGALEQYASDFLASMSKHPDKIAIGGLCWRFDDHNSKPGGDPTKSVWDATKPARIAYAKQGYPWLNILKIYNDSKFKPEFIVLNTWNDYEERTAMERGIPTELTVAIAAAQQGILSVTLDGNLATIDHVDIKVNGEIVSTQQPAASLSFDLNSLSPANGQEYDCQAIAVGQPMFQNQASATVKTSATLIPGRKVQVPIHLDTSAVVHVSGVFQGLTVAGDLTVPVLQDVMVPATIDTQILWSAQA